MLSSRHQQYLRELPLDWEQVPIQELGTICTGGTPSRAVPYYWNGSIAWVTPGELTTLDGKWLTETREYITEAGLSSSAAKLMPRGTLLVTTRASIGAVAVAALPVCTNQGFKSIIPNQFACSDFYSHLLQLISPEMVRLASGTTFLEISRKDFSAILLPRPPLPEQRRIADILDTVDAAIQQTEALIAKLKLMKAGLLHDLLTRGLDEQGNLRDPIGRPEQFKDSPLGRIPKEWEVVQLGSLAELITSGSRGWAAYYSEQGPLFLRIGNLTRQHINLRLQELVHVSPPAGGEGSRTALQEGDLLISITADLGIIGVIPSGFLEAYVNQHIGLVRLNTSKVNPRWAGNYLAGEIGQKQFYRLNDSGAKAGLNLPTVARLLIALPSMREQNKLAAIIDMHDARIRAEEAYCDKLKQLKQGLMHDLLTGRVRVQAEEEAL